MAECMSSKDPVYTTSVDFQPFLVYMYTRKHQKTALLVYTRQETDCAHCKKPYTVHRRGESPRFAVRVHPFAWKSALSPLSCHFSHALHSHKVSLDPFRKRFIPHKNVKSLKNLLQMVLVFKLPNNSLINYRTFFIQSTEFD